MPCARHGCGGARLGDKLYVVGGGYAAPNREGTLVSRLDLVTLRWSAVEEAELREGTFAALLQRGLPVESVQRLSRRPWGSALAFVPVGGISGRLVILAGGMPLAFNPARPAAGWLPCTDFASTASLRLGASAQACVEWADHLVVSTGRLDDEAIAEAQHPDAVRGCNVAAFSFLHPPTAREAGEGEEGGPLRPPWAEGVWTMLGTTGPTGRVGAGLTVVQDRLYISGGVDEGRGGSGFDGSVAQWCGTRAELDAAARGAGSGGGGDAGGGAGGALAAVDAAAANWALDAIDGGGDSARVRDCTRPWVTVEGLQMTTAMHAHAAIAVPWLPLN